MASKLRKKSNVADGASAIAHELDTANSLVTSGAKLLSVMNAGIEEFAINYDGSLMNRSGSGEVFTFLSRQTENSVQSAYEFRCNPTRSDSVPHTIWYNGNPGTVMMSANPAGSASMLTFLHGGGITGTATGLYGTVNNSVRFFSDRTEYRGDVHRFLTGNGSEGASGFFDVRTSIRNDGTSFNGRLGFDDNVQFGNLGGQGPTIYSNEASSASAGVFSIEAINDVTPGADSRLFSIRQASSQVCHIDAYGNLHTEDGWNMFSRGTNSDPGFASVTVTIINNTFDGGDSVTITGDAFGSLGFIQGVDFTVGGDANATASNLATAINASVISPWVSAQAATNVVTITSRFAGSLGNRLGIFESDGATDNFTLSSSRFSGGTDNGTGLVIDTKASLTNDPQRKLLSVRNGQLEKLHVAPGGGLGLGSKGVAVSASSTGETIIGVTSTASPRTITLDLDDEVEGRVVIIKDESGGAGTNNITVDTEGSSTIDGAASVTITANYGVLRIYFRNGNWFSF